MAPSAVSLDPTSPTLQKLSTPHPLAPLNADEIINASNLLRAQWPEGIDLHFKAVTLQEPPKVALQPFLDAENNGSTAPHPERKAFISYYLRRTNKFHEACIDLTKQKVDYNVRLGPNIHGSGDGDEIIAMEEICLADESVKDEVAKMKLPEGSVLAIDPWIYGADGVGDDERMYQCYMYMKHPDHRQEPDANYYATPLPLAPVISAEHRKVIRIDRLPTGADHTLKEPEPYKHRAAGEYTPEQQKLRTDLKPLNVVQPDGASFKVTQQGTSNLVEWQKWSFRIGFNQRESTVLYNVRYDGRSLFNRISLSDMNIPYADPRHPFHRKSAFDLGDAGAGTMVNDLKLGCDCLGSIHYLSYVLSSDTGGVTEKPNVICIHEQDGGIGWKHMNYRTGRAAVTRSRELVIQTILTVANYEYVLAYVFNQAAELHYEVRATGILSTQPVDDGAQVPWGTVVHPGVLAVHHQHIFSLRLDAAIDGPKNRLVYSEAHPLPRDSDINPHGNGYAVQDTLVEQSTGLDTAPQHNRTFKIANATAEPNPINGAAPAYKLQLPPFQKILADPSSFNHARAEFADSALYAVKYRDDELYAGGKYTNQSRGGTGVRSWANRKESIVDEDLVLYAQFGINHVPRVEDFPVMPCEVLRVALKPVNFFGGGNPALDVPPSEQAFNKSKLLSAEHRQGGEVEATVGANGGITGTSTTNGTNGTNGLSCH